MGVSSPSLVGLQIYSEKKKACDDGPDLPFVVVPIFDPPYKLVCTI